MEELKKRLMEQAGLEDAKADEVIEIVLAYGKEKAPSQFHGMIDRFAAGENVSGLDTDAALSAAKNVLGGLFKK